MPLAKYFYWMQGPRAQPQNWQIRVNVTLRISVHYDTLFLIAKKEKKKVLNVITARPSLSRLIHPHVWGAGNVTSKKFTSRRGREFAKSLLI